MTLLKKNYIEMKKAANQLQLLLRIFIYLNYFKARGPQFQPNKAEATPATAITIPPHLITD